MKEHKFVIQGGKELFGTIVNQTSKNAVLPIMSASLLANGEVKLKNVPKITDVYHMLEILQLLGIAIEKYGHNISLNMSNVRDVGIDSELSKTMRSSLFLLGSYLSRFKHCTLTLPGGCDIGGRPIDIHIKCLKGLGVKVKELGESVFFDATNAKCGKVKLRMPSVGATENLVQFASKLKGKTTILNAAREPEVVDLCNFLIAMGAKISGAGTNRIVVHGVEKLKGVEYTPIPDRIVSGTIMTAVAMCGGDVYILNAGVNQNIKNIEILRSMGCQIETKNDIIHIVSNKNLNSIGCVKTGCYPKFATDMQSNILVISCVSNGKTTIYERIFENRFHIVQHLKKMGANIKIISPHKVEIVGTKELAPAEVDALDLRGGAGLVIAGLSAKGETVVNNVGFIDRGYENLEKMFACLNADIRRV